jgi:hypothetical protein
LVFLAVAVLLTQFATLTMEDLTRETIATFVEKERVGHGEDADDHGTHVAENGSKNQSFEWGKYAHSLR